jgi:hypothetical protein
MNLKEIIQEMIEAHLNENTISKKSDFEKGRNDWHEYVQLNGYAFRPNNDGLKKLAAKTGRKKSDLAKSINTFLEA